MKITGFGFFSSKHNFMSVNKTQNYTYNKVVSEITVSEGSEKSLYISYLYNGTMAAVKSVGGRGELAFSGQRAVLNYILPEGETEFRAYLCEKIAEIIDVGYKYRFLRERLDVCLSRREIKYLCAALIAADLDGDKAFIRRKMKGATEYSIDGFYAFRLAALREKWERIIAYIPRGFSSRDLKKFCEFLVRESRKKIYLKDGEVYGENFIPLRRSRLLGEEDTETEIMLADAGFVYCLGGVEESVGDFLQKYYAERAVFS